MARPLACSEVLPVWRSTRRPSRRVKSSCWSPTFRRYVYTPFVSGSTKISKDPVVDHLFFAGRLEGVRLGVLAQGYANDIAFAKGFATAEAAAFDLHDQGIGVIIEPSNPWNDAGGYQPQTGAFQRAVDGHSPGLGPDTLRLVVPTGHSPHEQGALVAEYLGLSIDPPVMNQTGIADGSPGYQDRHTTYYVIHHLPGVQRTHRVSFGLSVDLDSDDQVRAGKSRPLSGNELRLVDGPDHVSAQELTELHQVDLYLHAGHGQVITFGTEDFIDAKRQVAGRDFL